MTKTIKEINHYSCNICNKEMKVHSPGYSFDINESNIIIDFWGPIDTGTKHICGRCFNAFKSYFEDKK